MRLFIRGEIVQPGMCCSPRVAEETWRQCPDVGLVDGAVPIIGDLQACITGLEPAVWFKVLVVDTVCIDFIQNCIQWTTCNHRNCKQLGTMGDIGYQRCKHTHECILNEDFYLPDVDLERGLELAKQILVHQDDDDQVDLLHLLHMYILPIIRLHSEDKAQVTQALTNQQQVLGELDSKIDAMSCQRTKIKQNMRLWREDICHDLQSENAIVSCNTSFLKLLCRHLESDIRNSYVELDKCQKKVEESKLRVQRKEGDHYVSQLNKARHERDKVADCITESLYVVEEVGLMIRSRKKTDSKELSDMHVAYMKIQEDWDGHTKDLTELQRKKVCATSVREALVSTKAELAEGGDTVGVEISSDGISRPTDVFGEVALPSGWETLQSQVAKSLELNPVTNELHCEFRQWMHGFYAEHLSNQQSHPSWREKLPSCKLQCTQVEESANVSCLKISPNNLTHLRQSIRERKPATHFQGLCKTLQNEVFLHFQEVVDQLVKDPAVPSTCYSRLWTCYERCLFPHMTKNLLQLYEKAFSESTKKLNRILPTVTIADLGLDDEWILNILGLYAPDFLNPVLEEEPEIGEEINEDELSAKSVEVEETERKEEVDETKSRERLESGISLQEGHPEVRRRRPSGKKRDNQGRTSNRYTKIIDTMWVTALPTVTAGASMSERSATWSGLDSLKRKSHNEGQPEDRLSSSVPNVSTANRDSVFRMEQSLPIDVPNTNSNARTLPSPITSYVGDSGVCLNMSKDKEEFEPSQLHPSSSTDLCDPVSRICQNNPDAKVFLERFQTSYNCFRVVMQDTVPMSKLQWLYKCIHEVNITAEKQSQLIFCGKRRMLSGDDLLTSLILFLLHGNMDEVVNGYCHLMILQDYLPDFLDKGHFGFTVHQFLLAYMYILDYEEKDEGDSS